MKVVVVLFCFLNIIFAQNPIKVLINPGHGGKDHGALASSSKYQDEKDLNLAIALQVEKYLKEYAPTIQVVLTRRTDVFHSLDEIVAISNKEQPDLFVSIHINSNENQNVKGVSIHVHNPDFKTSLNFASTIEADLRTRAKRPSRGVKTKHDRHHNLQILQQTKMPAVLIECGFITNKGEERYLNSNYGQTILASSIYRGIKKFVKKEYPTRFLEQSKPEVKYHIQLLSAKNKQNLKEYPFNKIKKEIYHKELNSSVYKFVYFCGYFNSTKEANSYLEWIKKNTSFKDAFVTKVQT